MDIAIEDVLHEAVETAFIPPKIWVVTFNVRAKGKGCVIVKAPNAKEAGNILKTSGMYNGTQSDYLITKCEEVVIPPCCGLMAEQVVTYDEYR